MDKAVIEFVLVNLRSVAQDKIMTMKALKKNQETFDSVHELEKFRTYASELLTSGGLECQIDKDKKEERHLIDYALILEIILTAVAVKHDKKNFIELCDKAYDLTWMYSEKEEIEVDKKAVFEIFAG